MTKHRDLAYQDPLPESLLDALEEFLGSDLHNFRLDLSNSTTLRLAAGTDNDQAAVAVNGRWRWRTTTITVAHPVGAAGQYDIFVTAADNSFTPGGPSGEIDNTDYSFGLTILAQGNTPGTTLYRKVGETTWDGAAISAITQIGVGPHARSHLPGGSDPIEGLGTLSLEDGAVTEPKIAANAVTAAKIATGAVGSDEIAADAVGASEIAAGAVGNSELAADAVTADKIATGAVGNTELTADAVTAEKIASGAVGPTELAPDAVTQAAIAAGAVGSTEIGTDAVGSDEIAASAVGEAEIANNAVTFAKLAALLQQAVYATGDVKWVSQVVAAGSEPPGWLLCDGREVSRTTYQALWDYYRAGGSNSPHGNGNGSTTFNLPDVRGRAPIGIGQGSGLTLRTIGQKSGAETHALAVAELPSHNHGGATGTGTTGDDSPDHTHTGYTGDDSPDHSHSGSTNTTGSHTHPSADNAQYVMTGTGATAALGSGGTTRYLISAYTYNTGPGGDHSHSFATGGASARHQHAVATYGASARHQHSVPALSISSQGSGTPHANMQPWIALTPLVKT